MGQTGTSHEGIDLDSICINDLIAKKEHSAGKKGLEDHSLTPARTNPDDYRIFVNDIFKKMNGREAFLTFSRQVHNVNRILNMTYSSAGDIAKVILQDMALTTQVLKIVNSSFYSQFSRKKGIATISEAMIILGTEEIRQVAAGLKVFEMMKELAHSQILREKTLKGMQRSIVARQLAWENGRRSSDALQISAMVYELGEYMVALLDPDTYIRVEIAMEENRISKDEAAKGIFGLTYSDLGRVVALKLNLPKEVVEAMRPVTRMPGRGISVSDAQAARYLCAFIFELCNLPIEENETTASCEAAGALADKYHTVVGVDVKKVLGLIRMSREKLARHAELLGIKPGVDSQGTCDAGVKNKEDLEHGLSRVDDALKEALSIHQIFTRLIDTMDKSFYFNQIVISIKKKAANTMVPRFLRGEERGDGFAGSLVFKIESVPDLFNNAIARKTDMVVKNVVKQAYKDQIPAWYVDKIAKKFKINGFAVFPVFVDDKIVAMIYVDWREDDSALTHDIENYISLFREQMIKAFTLHAGK